MLTEQEKALELLVEVVERIADALTMNDPYEFNPVADKLHRIKWLLEMKR